jgi:cell division protein FtsL
MLVVLVLIAAMTLLIMSNTRTLFTLKREIRLIEKKHHQHWTNSPPQRALTTAR